MAGIFNIRHITYIKLKSAAGEITLAPGNKEFQIEGMEQGGYEALPVLIDGDFQEFVPGNQTEKSFQYAVYHEGTLTDGSTKTVLDWLNQTGTAASEATKDAGGIVWALDVEIGFSRDGVSGTCTLSKVRLQGNYASQLNGNMVNLAGRFYPNPTFA